MKLFAVADLHVDRDENWRALQAMTTFPDDWLLVAGDVAETEDRFAGAMDVLADRFAEVFWTPGNHDLWTIPTSDAGDASEAAGARGDASGRQPAERLRGVAKYERLVALCRERGVHTPEDPYVPWPGKTPGGEDLIVAPIFTLYDYSFSPDDVETPEAAVAWAEETDCVCSDEHLLHPDPYPSRQAWCAARCRTTAARLARAAERGRLLLLNHYPLREEHAVLPRIPRFTPWCGTRRTQDWPTRFGAFAVVYGHLHIPTRRRADGVRFEEVSLGYPKQWNQDRGLGHYLRPLLEG